MNTEVIGSTNLSFGQALDLLKQGHKVSRSGWNGKGMFLKMFSKCAKILDRPDGLKESITSLLDQSQLCVQESGEVFPLTDFIGMKTADNTFAPWLASQTDVLANDWSKVVFLSDEQG